ncbi:MAG: hypothetical protein NC347_01990 [Clostridium sp.]|nr:hypothetical protein [Clostridium sp.]
MKKSGVFVAGALLGGLVGVTTGKRLSASDEKPKNNKFKLYYNVMNQWLYLKHNNKNLSEYFERKEYKRIGIYGLGELGNRLIDELKETKTEVVYGIDKNVNNTYCSVPTFVLDEFSDVAEGVDVIVVTPIFAYEEVLRELENKVNCAIVSLEDVVFEA